mgnify:CR=1 FL=1
MTTSDPFEVVRVFERELAIYTGAKYVVTTNSCTAALFLSFLWWAKRHGPQTVEIPARTYVSVPMVALQAGHRVRFTDYEWCDSYLMSEVGTADAAPTFLEHMYWMLSRNIFMPMCICISFHPRKPLGLSTGGGAILHDDAEADEWFRRMRFDGRTAGKSVAQDMVSEVGYHLYMLPPAAAEGLQRLSVYRPGPIVQDEYPDLRKMPVFQTHPGVVR